MTGYGLQLLECLSSSHHGVLLIELILPRDLGGRSSVRAWALCLGERKKALRFELPSCLSFGQLMVAALQLAQWNADRALKSHALLRWKSKGNAAVDVAEKRMYKSFWGKKQAVVGRRWEVFGAMWKEETSVVYEDQDNMVISYPFWEGSHTPTRGSQFVGVLQDLERLRDKKLCHRRHSALHHGVFRPEKPPD